MYSSTSHLNQTCPLPLHQAAAVILHKQYCSYYRNTLLPCTTLAQQIPMLMSQSPIHLATYGYSMSQEVDGSCHSNSLPLQTKSKTCSASSSSNCRHTSQAGRHCCHVALHFITTASTWHVATAQRTCRQVQSVQAIIRSEGFHYILSQHCSPCLQTRTFDCPGGTAALQQLCAPRQPWWLRWATLLRTWFVLANPGVHRASPRRPCCAHGFSWATKSLKMPYHCLKVPGCNILY